MKERAIIIGSGFGGLATGVRLAAKGYDVTVLESLDAPGGRAYVHRQDGFVFDGGPTIITAPFLLEELWALCGRKLHDEIDLRAIEPFYDIRFDDGDVLHYSGDPAAMRDEVRRISPADVDGYERFLELSRRIFEVGFERLGHVSFADWRTMLKVAPELVRLKSYRSVYGLVTSYVEHPKLRIALSFHPLLVGGNPFQTTSVYALIAYLERRWGVHYVMGGTGRLVDGLCDLIRGQGGQIRFNAKVAAIETEDGCVTGVRLASGERLASRIVVSNADSATTYRKLLPAGTSRRWHPRRLKRARYSMSLFVWYFGTDRRYDDVPHHSILLGPRYRELLDDIFKHHRLADDFSLYLHRPTATDPAMAPDGCDAFYVLSPVPHQASGTDWDTRAERYRQAIEDFLAATVLPGLGAHVVSSRVMTPQDFESRLDSYQGAAFGLAPTLTQSAWFRPHNVSRDVDGLYFVGAGTHPGAGVPGVLSSARVVDSALPDLRNSHDLP